MLPPNVSVTYASVCDLLLGVREWCGELMPSVFVRLQGGHVLCVGRRLAARAHSGGAAGGVSGEMELQPCISEKTTAVGVPAEISGTVAIVH